MIRGKRLIRSGERVLGVSDNHAGSYCGTGSLALVVLSAILCGTRLALQRSCSAILRRI